jgi:hypothetical protein
VFLNAKVVSWFCVINPSAKKFDSAEDQLVLQVKDYYVGSLVNLRTFVPVLKLGFTDTLGSGTKNDPITTPALSDN